MSFLTRARAGTVLTALIGLLSPACQQGTGDDHLGVRRAALLTMPQPGDTIVLDFSTDAQGNPLSRGTVLAEQFAAAGIHFTGGYILGDRTVDFASYAFTPTPNILICTREGGDPGGCGAPQDRPAAGVPLGITLDFPVCYASIVGRSVVPTGNPTQIGIVSMSGYDASGSLTASNAVSHILVQPLTIPPVLDPMTGFFNVGEGQGVGFIPSGSAGAPATGQPRQGLDVHRLEILDVSLGSFDDLTLIRCQGLQPKCKNQTVCTSAAQQCVAANNVDIDNGSYDASNDQPVTVSQSPGPPFPLGTTAVTLMVSQGSATASCVGLVTVGDCNPPTVTCPPPSTEECAPQAGQCTAVPEAIATDSCSAVTVSASPVCVGLGTTVVSYNAIGTGGLTSTCSTTMTVVDTQPPVVTVAMLNGPIDLTPADGTMRSVSLDQCSISIDDVCDRSQGLPSGTFAKIRCVSSDQDGACVRASDDIQVVDDQTVLLRAQTNVNGAERAYSIELDASDRSGNTAPGTCVVTVPGSGGQGGGGGDGGGGRGGDGDDGSGGRCGSDGGRHHGPPGPGWHWPRGRGRW